MAILKFNLRRAWELWQMTTLFKGRPTGLDTSHNSHHKQMHRKEKEEDKYKWCLPNCSLTLPLYSAQGNSQVSYGFYLVIHKSCTIFLGIYGNLVSFGKKPHKFPTCWMSFVPWFLYHNLVQSVWVVDSSPSCVEQVVNRLKCSQVPSQVLHKCDSILSIMCCKYCWTLVKA